MHVMKTYIFVFLSLSQMCTFKFGCRYGLPCFLNVAGIQGMLTIFIIAFLLYAFRHFLQILVTRNTATSRKCW